MLGTGILITIVSFSMLATLIVMLSARYAAEERTRIMSAFGESLSKMSDYITNPYASFETIQIFKRNLSVIAEGLNAHIVVINSEGRVMFTSDNVATAAGAVIKGGAVDSVLSGRDYLGGGTLGGLFETNKYTVGIPISHFDQVIGAVFVSSAPVGHAGISGDIGRVFMLCFLTVLTVSIVLTYCTTGHIMRPIRQMSAASKRFAKGDFSARVAQTGKGEIGELTDSFNNMAASLENIEELRNTFIANVSHDLRTPMTTISGFVDGILDGTIPPEEHDKYLSVVSGEAKRLSRLVRTLLDVSKFESDEYVLNLSEFDIVEAFRRTALLFVTRIEEKQLGLELVLPENEIAVYADMDALTRVVYNLLDNAVKFTERGGYIILNLREQGNGITFKIRNSGGGISKQDLNYIFERFYKTDYSRGLDKSGLGLGLYIVKMLVSKHDGTISVNSDGGSFCEFEINIPKRQHSLISKG